MPSGGDESTLFEECVFRFDSVPTDVLEGSATIQISTEDGYVADVIFSYTVVRESTMLDWIQEWEGNKTQIGGNSIITPRLFVGKKITNGENYNSIFNVPQLTGVYIGPAGENGNSCGVYGYKAGGEIFIWTILAVILADGPLIQKEYIVQRCVTATGQWYYKGCK